MAQTVIGFFKDEADAQKAVSHLESKGISSQYVDVSKGKYEDGTADLEGRNTNRFTDLFNKLFGHDSDDAKRYSTLGQKNVTMVTVHAQSEELAEEAADVLDDCGAIDVDEDASTSDYNINSSSSSNPISNSSSDNLQGDTDNLSTSSNTGSGSARRRSRIIDSSIDDELRFRG